MKKSRRPGGVKARALFVAVALLAVSVMTSSAQTAPQGSGAGGLEKIGEFRPFPSSDNPPTGVASLVDQKRQRWLFLTLTPGADGPYGRLRVFDLASMRQLGAPVDLPGPPPAAMPVMGIDESSGRFFLLYTSKQGFPPAFALAAYDIGAGGATKVVDRPISTGLQGPTTAAPLVPQGMDVVDGKLYVGADAGGNGQFTPQVALLRFDANRLVRGENFFDWRFTSAVCSQLAMFRTQAAVGRSRFGPTVMLPCRRDVTSNQPTLQGAVRIDVRGDDPAEFEEELFPIAGDYSSADSFYDPGSDRLMMRRVGPAQVVVFDGPHRVWLPPFVLGQGNLYQVGLSPDGRVYGMGNDQSVERYAEFFFAAEARTTPPQNGLTLPFTGPSPEATLAPTGVLAVDGSTKRIFVADLDATAGTDAFGNTSYTPRGLFFHVYRDTRPSAVDAARPDPDKSVVALSGEAQGYGGRVSYVGGIGGTYSNAFGTHYGSTAQSQVVAGGTRHAVMGRTTRLRITENDATAEAVSAHPEGATAAELTLAEQPWPYEPVTCVDFGGQAADKAGTNASVQCDADSHKAVTQAAYDAAGDAEEGSPFRNAKTSATSFIDAKRGVVTTVESETAFTLPGVLSIGRIVARTTTWAGGRDGAAGSTYEREMSDVVIAGKPFCQASCDPKAVAAEINRTYADPGRRSATALVASIPEPDPLLLGSPGGVEAIVQRERWDHLQDLAIHDGADDRYELPAFVLAYYQDRTYPQHEVYWMAGVQAVSRLPQRLAGDLDELATPDPGVDVDPVTGTVLTSVSTDDPTALAGGRAGVPGAGRARGGAGRFPTDIVFALASPLGSPGILGFWMFLAVPVFLSSRRRLMQRHQEISQGGPR